MMSLMEMARMKALEQKVEQLEARLSIVERAESFAVQNEPRRRPGRPRKIEQREDSAA